MLRCIPPPPTQGRATPYNVAGPRRKCQWVRFKKDRGAATDHQRAPARVSTIAKAGATS
jgi:hypothetical protein